MGRAVNTLVVWSGRVAIAVGFAAGVVVLLLWLAGKFEAKVPQGDLTLASNSRKLDGQVVSVRRISQPVVESAAGTIRAVHETTIGSKLLARVVEIDLKAGQKVRTGDVLVRLDDTDVRAKLEQAKAALASAQANRSQAAADENRLAQLVSSRAVSQQQYDRMLTDLKAAEAECRRAEELVKEVQATLDWATIRATMDGTVIDKKVNVGDTVTPGQPLLTLFDPTRMQLVASVRESLTHRLEVGQEIPVRIDALGKQCSGIISEIVPEAQSASRSFQVKVIGPCPTGVYSGMFGRIQISRDEEQVLVIPRRAVRIVGQLELVEVVAGGHASRRAIRIGRTLGDDVEVLSGLQEGEKVLIVATTESKEVTHE